MSWRQRRLTFGVLSLRGHVAALDFPLIALPLEDIIHNDRLAARSPFRSVADCGVRLLFLKRDGIDSNIHVADVYFAGDVLEDARLYGFWRVDVL